MNIITTPTDMHGLCFCDGKHHVVTDTIIDMSAVPADKLDEAVAVVWGMWQTSHLLHIDRRQRIITYQVETLRGYEDK